MKTPKTIPLFELILEVVKLQVQRGMQAEIQKAISELETYSQSLSEPTKPKRQRRAA
jgi:hypothetical protein